MVEEKLTAFVQFDRTVKELEADLEYAKAQRRNLEDWLLDNFGMNGKTNALVELEQRNYKVYVRRTTMLRESDHELAVHTLRVIGLDDFVSEKIDTGRLGMYYKKREKAGEELPVLEGLDFTETYRLYVLRKK